MPKHDPVMQSLLSLASERQDIAALWLYGSRARESHHATSDYDLAVVFTDWIDSPLDRRLRPELLALDWLEALNLPEGQLSVVDLAIAPIPLAWTIISEGSLLWDPHPQLRMRQETRIMSRWELDYLHSGDDMAEPHHPGEAYLDALRSHLDNCQIDIETLRDILTQAASTQPGHRAPHLHPVAAAIGEDRHNVVGRAEHLH